MWVGVQSSCCWSIAPLPMPFDRDMVPLKNRPLAIKPSFWVDHGGFQCFTTRLFARDLMKSPWKLEMDSSIWGKAASLLWPVVLILYRRCVSGGQKTIILVCFVPCLGWDELIRALNHLGNMCACFPTCQAMNKKDETNKIMNIYEKRALFW